MKTTFTLFIALFFTYVAFGQRSVISNDGELLVKEREYDFGKIVQGKPVYHTFEIVNKGKEPVSLDNVLASCGCTTPEWTKGAIKPEEVSAIKVGFNAMAEGYFEKDITITYNIDKTKVIKIKGAVWPAPVGAAPANASIQFLKQQLQQK